MMSFAAFKFYYWLMFIWGGLGMLFIFIVATKEMIQQLRTNKATKKVSSTKDSDVESY
jgi:hypothetical protein